MNVSDPDLFGTAYNADGEVDPDGTAIVKVSSAGNIVGPGSEGSMTFTIAGTAEVATQIDISLVGTDVYFDPDTTLDDNTYYPVKWTLTVDGVEKVAGKTLADVQEYFADEVTAKKIAAGQKFGDGEVVYVLSYVWEFDTSNETNDLYDTFIGAKANDPSFTFPVETHPNGAAGTTTSVAFTINIKQIQEDVEPAA